jgi:hypothetical protein
MSPPLRKKKTQPAPSFDAGLDLREPEDDLSTVALRGDGSSLPLRDLREMVAKMRGWMSNTDEVMVEVGERKPFLKLSKTLRSRGNR